MYSPSFFVLLATAGLIGAGVVGVVSLTESRANALIGVFISVTTIPAAAMSACLSPSAVGEKHAVRPCNWC